MTEKPNSLARDLWNAGCGWILLVVLLAGACLVTCSNDEQRRRERWLNGTQRD